MDRLYFSKNNYNLIFNIVRGKLHAKFEYDIQKEAKFGDEILNIMKSIYKQKHLYNINFSRISDQQGSIELTKQVLKTLYPLFSEYIQKNQRSNIHKKENVVDSRPEPSSTNNPNDINKMFENLQNDRNNINIQAKNDIIFTENIENNNSTINKKFEEISNERNSEYSTIVNEMNSGDDNAQFNQDQKQEQSGSIHDQFGKQEQSGSIHDQFGKQEQSGSIHDQFNQGQATQSNVDSIHNQFNQGPSTQSNVDSIHNQFNQGPSNQPNMDSIHNQFNQGQATQSNVDSIHNQFNQGQATQSNVDSIHNQFNQGQATQSNVDSIHNQFNQGHVDSINNQLSKPPHSDDMEIKHDSLSQMIVNNVENSLNKYYSKLIKTQIEIPKKIKTLTLLINSVDRTWYDKIYKDDDEPLKNIIEPSTYQDRYNYRLTFSPDKSYNGISIDRRIRNVVSIKLKRLIVPNYDEYFEDIPIGAKADPYLILSIDELNSNTISSNPLTKTIFSKAIFDKEFRYNENADGTRSPLTRGWLYYKNDDNDKTEFYPKSLTELTNLTIKLLRPNGSIYSNAKDNLIIKSLVSDGSKIQITLNSNPDKGYFMKGDKIQIKTLLNDDDNNELIDNSELRNYLENGVYVLDQGDNVITINNKIINKETNNYMTFTTINCKGSLINESLQHSIILEVNVEEVI